MSLLRKKELPVSVRALFRVAHIKGVDDEVLKAVADLIKEHADLAEAIDNAHSVWFTVRGLVDEEQHEGNRIYRVIKAYNATLVGKKDTDHGPVNVYAVHPPLSAFVLSGLKGTVVMLVKPSDEELPVLSKVLSLVQPDDEN